MGPAIRLKSVGIGAGLLGVLVAVALWAKPWSHRVPLETGLFTSLPILWNEESDVGAILDSRQPEHWSRTVLAGEGRIVALDTLAAPAGRSPLAPLTHLVMAQPRPLGPAENVALDDWVRGGGRLLLLADPALTQDSRFAIGDPRRPQAVVLLSPILKRWGLDLRFDEAQPFGERTVFVGTTALPVNLPGRFVVYGGSRCRTEANGIVAICRIGKGRVTAIADAAVLEPEDPGGARAKAFAELVRHAFSD